jgi:hypothetical protein
VSANTSGTRAGGTRSFNAIVAILATAGLLAQPKRAAVGLDPIARAARPQHGDGDGELREDPGPRRMFGNTANGAQ